MGIKGAMVVEWDEPSCIMCGVCVKACREGAITMADGKIILDTDKCNYCGRCAKACPTDAWKGETGYLVSFGGLFGNTIHRGEELLPVVTSFPYHRCGNTVLCRQCKAKRAFPVHSGARGLRQI